jgi:2,3-bisphosphoglycerate-dependent phosphoglycerate mutase
VTPPAKHDATAASDPPSTPPTLTSPSTPLPAEVPPAPAPPTSPLDRAFLTNQSGVATLILVRHGQQVWPQSPNAAASEWVDPPLSETGRRQAEVVGAALAREVVDAVYSSHLKRALETGRQIGRHHGMQPQVFSELREIEMFRDLPAGTRMRDAIAEPILRGIQERFVHERCWDVYPFTEGSAAFRNRVVNTIEGILATHSGQRVVIACHGGVINAYIGHILGLREDMFFRPAHASVSRVLARDGRRVVQSLNEVHHLGEVHAELVTT